MGPCSDIPLVVARTSRASLFAYSGATRARERNLIRKSSQEYFSGQIWSTSTHALEEA